MGLKSREERLLPGIGPRYTCLFEGTGGPGAVYPAVFTGLFELKASPELMRREVPYGDLPERTRAGRFWRLAGG